MIDAEEVNLPHITNHGGACMFLSNGAIRKVFRCGVFCCFVGLLLVSPCLAQKASKGEATVVVQEPFAMTGGDPHTSFGAGSMNITNFIHESLVIKGYDGKLGPALAKSWQVSKDGLNMTFTLNERAKFHNGAPVTAEDVKFSIERAMRPELKYNKGGTMRQYLEKVEVLDDHRVAVHFKSPYPALLEWCAQALAILPKAYLEKVGDAEFTKHPIGAGPFKWIDYEQDVSINAEAVADHYRKVPSVKTIHFKFVQEPATIIAMLKAGEADIVQIPRQNLPEVKKDPKFRIVWSKFIMAPSLGFFDLGFPDEQSPFKDRRVRRAASLAINRKAICDKVLNGAAEPWGDIFAPYNPGYNPNIKPDPYDPQKAKALLKEAGYPNGFDTTFTCGLLGDQVESQAIAADLARVGIRAKIIELEAATYLRSYQEKKIHGLVRAPNPSWVGMAHPGVAVESVINSKNYNSYSTTPKNVEAAWEKLYGTSDEKAIVAQAREVSRLYREAEVRDMLWAIHTAFALSPRVKNYKPIQGKMQIVGLEYLELKD
jgi:peptide/nickel transport system substrate-binding protein